MRTALTSLERGRKEFAWSPADVGRAYGKVTRLREGVIAKRVGDSAIFGV